MKHVEKRRARSLWAALLHDPLRKATAIAMAIGLWFFVDKQISASITFTLPLTAVDTTAPAVSDNRVDQLRVVLPTDLVAPRSYRAVGGEPVATVALVVSGPKYRIDGLANTRLQLSVAGFKVDWKQDDSVEFDVNDIQRNDRIAGLQLAMTPARVRVEFQHLGDKTLPLSLDAIQLRCDDRLAARLRRQRVEFSRDSVRVTGPARELAGFPRAGTRPFVAELRALDNERQCTAEITLAADPELRLRMTDPCALTIQLLPVLQEFTLDVPLQIDDLALAAELQGQYRPEARSRSVRIKAGGELRSTLIALGDEQRQRWARDHLRLLVWVPRREDGQGWGNEIVREAGLQVLGPLAERVDPVDYGLADHVSVTLRRQP